MNTLKIAACGILTLLAVACGKSETSNKPVAPAIPTSLEFEKPAEGPELTKTQAAEIKAFFSGKPMMILPPGELVFPHKNANPDDLALKEDMLRDQDPNSADMLLDIRKGCQKNRPTSSIDATFPMDGLSLDNMKTEDHASFTASAGLSGSACPAQFHAGAGASVRVLEVENQSKYLKASGGTTAKLNAAINNEKYAKLLNTRGVIMDGKISALASTTDMKDNKMLLTAEMSGSYLSLRADLPYTMKIQHLLQSVDEKSSDYETMANSEVRFPRFTVRIDVRLSGNTNNPQPTTQELYVNGRLMSPKEFEDLFGKSNPAGEPSNLPVMNILN